MDIAEDGALLIFFTEVSGEATLIRRLPPNRQGLRVGLEQAAIVVRSLVEALLEGGNVGIATPNADRSLGSTAEQKDLSGPALSPKTAPSITAPSSEPTLEGPLESQSELAA